MPKYLIIRDERWPDYSLIEDENGQEIDPVLVKKYKRVNAEYSQLQRELSDLKISNHYPI